MFQLSNCARNVDSYVKLHRGRRPGTNTALLTDLVAKDPDFQVDYGIGEIPTCPYIIYPKNVKKCFFSDKNGTNNKKYKGSPKTDGKVDIRAYYIYEEALKVFLKGCPTAEKLATHQAEMDALTLCSPEHAKRVISEFDQFVYATICTV